MNTFDLIFNIKANSFFLCKIRYKSKNIFISHAAARTTSKLILWYNVQLLFYYVLLVSMLLKLKIETRDLIAFRCHRSVLIS